jgi:exodeoxyribonuclease VII large subunit
MADPVALVRARRQEVSALRSRAATRIEARLHRAADEAEHLRRQVVALSPQSTLERGYAVVQHRDGRIVMDPDDVGAGELLRVRVARGDFRVRPVSAGAEDPPERKAAATKRAAAPRKAPTAKTAAANNAAAPKQAATQRKPAAKTSSSGRSSTESAAVDPARPTRAERGDPMPLDVPRGTDADTT